MNNVADRTVKPSPLNSRGYADRRTPGHLDTAHAAMTATRSPLNSRGYADRRTPGQTEDQRECTPKGVPHQRLQGGTSMDMGDPFRVDVIRTALSAGRPDLRLLRGEALGLLCCAAVTAGRDDLRMQ